MKTIHYADMVLVGGVIYTADSDDNMAEAVAVKSGRIISVGSTESINKLVGPQTDVFDLSGKMVLPGMIDSHLHPPGVPMTELFSISLSWTARKADLLAAVKAFIDNNPGLNQYYGRGWSASAFEGEELRLGPKKESLDRLCPDVPIILKSYDGHSFWLNSKAFEVSGIDKDTPDPEGVRITRDPYTKEPWGNIAGAECSLIPRQEYTREQFLEGMEAFQKFMHSLGYTGVFAASFQEDLYEVIEQLEIEGKLKLWFREAKRLDMKSEHDIDSQIERLIELSKRYNSELYKVNTAKIFIDGVVEAGTARLLEPYENEQGKGEDGRGVYYWEDMDALRHAIKKVNEAGLQVHFHSVGDQATREALDAFEDARKEAPGEHRNAITHLQLVAKQDLQRFRELGVIANVQTYWHLKEPGWWHEVDAVMLGARAENEYPLRSLLDAGALLASSSDHSVVDYPNPLWAIKVGVTRNLSNAEYFGVDDIAHIDDKKWLLNKDERISLKEMIKSFTANNAYALIIEKHTGTIEPGKYADLVVLDQNLFKTDPLRLDSVQIVKTIFHGEVVYEA